MAQTVDEKYMSEALALASKGYGHTRTNPLVGAVVVNNKTIVGRGYHAVFGGPHAEVVALKKAGKKSNGATLYVTLEPCSTHGKTPPCTEAILRVGIKRVVIAAIDPNPVHAHKGIRFLKKNGIQVKMGVLQKEAQGLNPVFQTIMSKKRPFVTLKLAQSLDGKIATHTGHSQWITSEASRKRVHGLRAVHDAIMVGTNTIRQDDPLLTVRTKKNVRNPIRIVLDKNASLSLAKNVFKHARRDGVIVCTAKKLSTQNANQYQRKGISIIELPLRNGRIDLKRLFQRLLAFDIGSVFVEGGSELAASLLNAGLVDRLLLFVAPRIIGGLKAPSAIAGRGVKRVDSSIHIKNMTCSQVGTDYLFEGIPVINR